jgi:hypothetical protein
MIWTRRESFGGLSNDDRKNCEQLAESVVECKDRTSLNRDINHAGGSFRVRKGPKGKNAGRQFRRRERDHSLLEQPVADMSGTVPCKVCGHPVDQKRLQAHMVRFHGASC